MDLSVDLRGVADDLTIQGSTQLHDPDLKKVNSKAAPDAVSPVANSTAKLEDGRLTVTLKRQSWNVVNLARG
jgi:alpha-N-arabinofuranosidase